MSDNALFQNSFYVGNSFNLILYGVNLVLYAQTMYIYTSSKSPCRGSARFFMFFSTVSLILITIYVSVQSTMGEEMWIVNANYPGGSAAYLQAHAAVWYETMGTAAPVVLQMMSDGLWIHRCSIVWRDRRIIVLPCFLWLVTSAFGIFDLYVSGSPSGNFFVGFAAEIGVIYIATSIALNVLVTSLICGRVLYYALDMRSQSQIAPGFAKPYFSTAALIVESALPYTLCGIALVVSYGLNSGISIFFLSLYSMFMCLSPQMLILRVASGNAWNADTMTRTGSATIQFERGSDTTSTTFSAVKVGDLRKNETSQDEEMR